MLRHAKDYIDDLANGKNPFTKEPVGEADIVNNVKISRCLFYVSSVLGEVIENGGVSKASRAAALPFSPEALNFDNMEYSSTPTNISSVVEKVNALKPEDMDRLKVTAVTGWLVDVGMLHVVTVNGKGRKSPTPKGSALGIIEEERSGQRGVYTAVLYNEAAQRFIVQNLGAVISGGYNDKKRRTPPEDEDASSD